MKFYSCYDNLKKKKDDISEAFNRANNKDIQLQESMTQMNKTRKKTKEMIIEEKKKLDKLERVPEESRKVDDKSHIFLFFIIFF